MAKFTTMSKDELEMPAVNGVEDEQVLDAEDGDDEIASDDLIAQVKLAATVISEHVFNVGQSERLELRKLCAEKGYNTDIFGRALRFLTVSFPILTDTVNDAGRKVFVWKRRPNTVPDVAMLFDASQEGKAPGTRKKVEHYGDWYTVSGTLTLVTPALSSRPPDNREAGKTVFIKDGGGNPVLLDTYFKLMFQNACQKPGAPELGNAKYKVEFDYQIMPKTLIKHVQKPVPPRVPGGAGQGLTDAEALPPGTKIPFTAYIPGSHITEQQFGRVMTIAGKWQGISPAAYHKGFGRYTVEFLKVESQEEEE